jgi:hypothetical protein
MYGLLGTAILTLASPLVLASTPVARPPPARAHDPPCASEMCSAPDTVPVAPLPPTTPESPGPAEQPSARDTLVERLLHRLHALDAVPLPMLYVGAPGISAQTPVAFGGSFGQIGIGAIYFPRARYNQDRRPDGAIGFVLGLGQPSILGIDATVTITDLRQDQLGRGGLGHRGLVGLKVHRRRGNVAVAVGVQNLLHWGSAPAHRSVYAVATARSGSGRSSDGVSGRVYGSLGVGTGRFRSLDALKDGRETVGVFGNLAFSVTRPLRVFAEWSGQDLGLGVSLVPVRRLPAIVSVAVVDVTRSTEDRAHVVIGVGYGFTIAPWRKP